MNLLKRERREKVDDIKRNIRDAILVILTALLLSLLNKIFVLTSSPFVNIFFEYLIFSNLVIKSLFSLAISSSDFLKFQKRLNLQ